MSRVGGILDYPEVKSHPFLQYLTCRHYINQFDIQCTQNACIQLISNVHNAQDIKIDYLKHKYYIIKAGYQKRSNSQMNLRKSLKPKMKLKMR